MRVKLENEIQANVAMCGVCKDIMVSNSTHDFNRCGCGQSFTDGGSEYIRRGGNAIHLRVFTDAK